MKRLILSSQHRKEHWVKNQVGTTNSEDHENYERMFLPSVLIKWDWPDQTAPRVCCVSSPPVWSSCPCCAGGRPCPGPGRRRRGRRGGGWRGAGPRYRTRGRAGGRSLSGTPSNWAEGQVWDTTERIKIQGWGIEGLVWMMTNWLIVLFLLADLLQISSLC